MRNVDMIIIHCSATKATSDITAETVRKWHRERGWSDIGYHFFIRLDGTIEKGRPLEIPGSHARGYNNRSIGICYAGGLDGDMKPSDTRTAAQKNSMEALVTILKIVHGDHLEIVGHRDLPNVAKACPCFDVKKWWKDVTKTN
jgi:N-acetylmuramoyl-L-alanine amidase